MKMQFMIISRLLQTTPYILVSGYIAFLLSSLILLLNTLSILQTLGLFCLITALLFLQHYFFIRVKLDADLLKHLSKQLNTHNMPLDEITHELDQALIALKFTPQEKAGRDWPERIKACLKLFKFQFLLLILQYLVFIFLVCYFKTMQS